MTAPPNRGSLAAALVGLALVALGTAAGASDYVGARRCKSCHPAEYEHWRRTPHARATVRLTPAQRRDRRCTSCHATSAPDGLLGVQCESCHGPGRHYWPEPVMKDVELARAVGLTRGTEPEVCGRCHTADAPTLVPFDLKAALEKVRHPPPGRESR